MAELTTADPIATPEGADILPIRKAADPGLLQIALSQVRAFVLAAFPTLDIADAGKPLVVNEDGDGYEYGTGGAAFYRYGGFAVSDILASEILMDHVVADAHTLAADFAGCQVTIGANPTADPWVASVKQDGTEIGTISITAAGAITVETDGGTSKAVAAGDVISVHGPAGADATLARLSFTFRGTI